ncbi:MAG: 50S ribosomal protein L31 [Elusimicrobiota bacterium]
MKPGIHPNYYNSNVRCACGNTFVTRSTLKEIKLEICSACHPFYTGKQRLVDTAGRVERFSKRFAKTGGETVRRAPKTDVKKIESLAGSAIVKRSKVLSSAPTTADAEKPKGKGKSKAKKTASPAAPAADKA